MSFVSIHNYVCCDCNTFRYLIFPYGNESFIICSACFRIRNEEMENNKICLKNKTITNRVRTRSRRLTRKNKKY
jgi:hypothetical protein